MADRGKHCGKPLRVPPRRKKLSKRERVLAKAEAEQIAEENQYDPIPEMDLETAAYLFLQEVDVGLSVHTLPRYKSTIKEFIRIIAGRERIPLKAVSEMHLREFRDKRLKKHAGTTVRNDLKCLSSMFSWFRRQRDPLTRERWIHENPVEDVEYPHTEPTQKHFPSKKEVRSMLAKLKKQPLKEYLALGLFGAYAGMRLSEITHLKVENVDLEGRLLRVFHGKSKNPRPIPMHPDIYQFLMDWPMEGEYVFHSPRPTRGGEYWSDTLGRNFRAWLRKNKLKFTHKNLRDYFNDALRRNPQLSASARLLIVGHEDERTNRVYSNPQAEEARPFVEQLGR